MRSGIPGYLGANRKRTRLIARLPFRRMPLRPSTPRTIAVLALCAMTVARGVGAQGPRGAGPDARPLPAGTLRISAGATWDRTPEEYVGSGAGSLRGLGWRFSMDSLASAALPTLGTVESLARTASGVPTLRASLGTLAAEAIIDFDFASVSGALTPRSATRSWCD